MKNLRLLFLALGLGIAVTAMEEEIEKKKTKQLKVTFPEEPVKKTFIIPKEKQHDEPEEIKKQIELAGQQINYAEFFLKNLGTATEFKPEDHKEEFLYDLFIVVKRIITDYDKVFKKINTREQALRKIYLQHKKQLEQSTSQETKSFITLQMNTIKNDLILIIDEENKLIEPYNKYINISKKINDHLKKLE